MSQDPALDQLNHLVTVNKDMQKSLETAADNIRNSELETQFRNYATQHGRFWSELQAEIEREGKIASGSGLFGATVQRSWMDVKAALSGHSAGGILATCEDIEQSCESAYLDALEVITSGKAHTLLEKHYKQIKAVRTRLTRLVAEIRDGRDFQKNE